MYIDSIPITLKKVRLNEDEESQLVKRLWAFAHNTGTGNADTIKEHSELVHKLLQKAYEVGVEEGEKCRN